MEYKVLIVANPVAGRIKANKFINKIKENLEKQNFEVSIRYTSLKNSAYDIVSKYDDNLDIILVSGGDGTLSQVVQGIYDSNINVCLGFIPTGTTNDFAKSLKVSFIKTDISEKILDYKSKKIDIGVINKEQIFNYVMAFGIFSKASYNTKRMAKRVFGKLAYIYSGIKELFYSKTYKLKIKSDTLDIEDEFFYGSISNSKYIGGFHILKNENVKLNDGKFEVILVKKPKRFIPTMKLITKILWKDLDDENICCFKTSRLKIESEDNLEWTIDGEYGGIKNNLDIQVKYRFVEYLLPGVESIGGNINKLINIKNDNEDDLQNENDD